MAECKIVQSDLIDQLLADYQKPEDLFGGNGILRQLIKAMVERALQAELVVHDSISSDTHDELAKVLALLQADEGSDRIL